MCAIGCAVGNDEFCGAQHQQRCDYAASGTACADDEHAAASEIDAEVVAQVVHETGAVRVVAEQPVVALDGERVHGHGAFCPGREFVRKLSSRDFVRHRHVEAASAARKEIQHVGAEVLRKHVVQPVDQLFTRLPRKHAVNEG